MDVALVGNKIYVGGYAAYSPGTSDFVLARFNANGTLDTTFGKRGSVATDFGNQLDFGTTMVVQPDGKIILAGTSDGLFAAVRYNPDGTLDAGFGSRGKVTINAGEFLQNGTDRYVDLALSGDRIILAGASRNTDGNHVHVVQLTAGGQLDTAFGAGGIAHLGVGNNPRLAVQTDGKLVLAYNSFGSESDVIVSRLLPNGSTDTGFGSAGAATLPGAVTGFARSTAVSLDSLGQIVLGGWVPGPSGATTNGKLFIARFTAGGNLDTTFGVNGWNTTGNLANVYANRNAFVSLTLQPDGKAVVVGTTSDWKFATARFLTTGPAIGSFAPSSPTVAADSPVTLTASGVTPQNPGSTVTQVAIYADANGDGKLDASDTLLGYATQTASGTWTLTLSTAGWTSGSYTLFARATDSLGALSDPLSLTLSVI